MPLPVLPAICVGMKPVVKDDRVRYYTIIYKMHANGTVHPTTARSQTSFPVSERALMHTLMLTICQNHVLVQHADAVTDRDYGSDGTCAPDAWRCAKYSFSEPVCDAVVAAFDLQLLQHHPDVLVLDKKLPRTALPKTDRDRDDNHNEANRTLFICIALAQNRVQLCSPIGDVYDIYLKFPVARLFPSTLYYSKEYGESKPKRIDGLLIERQVNPGPSRNSIQALTSVDARLYALSHPLHDIQPILCDSSFEQSSSSSKYYCDSFGKVMDCICINKGKIKMALLICYAEQESQIKVYKLMPRSKQCTPHSLASRSVRAEIRPTPNKQYQFTAMPAWQISREHNYPSNEEMSAFHSIETVHGDNMLVLYIIDPAKAQILIQSFQVDQQHVSAKGTPRTLKCINAVPIARNEAGQACQDLIVLSENCRLYLYHVDTPICEIALQSRISNIFPSSRNTFEVLTYFEYDDVERKQLQIMHPLDSEAHTGSSSLWMLLWDVLEYCLPAPVTLCIKASVLQASRRECKQARLSESNGIEFWELTLYLEEMAKVAFQTFMEPTVENQVPGPSEYANHTSAFRRMCRSNYHFDYRSQNPFLFLDKPLIDDEISTAGQPSLCHEKKLCQDFSRESFWNPSIVLLIFESLHLLHEDLRLRHTTNSLSDRQSLSQILESLAVQLNLVDYIQYYQITRPYSTIKSVKPRYSRPQESVRPFCTGDIGQMVGDDDHLVHARGPPDLFSWLYTKRFIFTSSHSSQFPTLAKYLDNTRSRANRKSPLWRSEILVRIYGTLKVTNSSTMASAAGANSNEMENLLRTLEFLSEDKVGSQLDLQKLPYGIACPFLIAISQMRDFPSPYLSEKSCILLDRKDLTLMPDLDSNSWRDVTTCGSTEDDTECGDDGLDLVMMQSQILFPTDRRLKEVSRLLRSSSPVYLKFEKSNESSEDSLRAEQQSRLLLMCKRTMALPVARGMVTYGTYYPPSSADCDISSALSRQDDSTIAWQLKVPALPLAGRIPPTNIVITLDVSSYAKELMYWPQFHNGCATGLRLPSDDKLGIINRYWIRFHRPRPEDYQGSTSTSASNGPGNHRDSNRNESQHTADINEAYASHGGFLLGLGLQGHLQCLSMADVYNYLSLSNEHLSIGILLGMAITAANIRRRRHLKNGEGGKAAKKREESQDISRLSEYDFDLEDYLQQQENRTHGEDESSVMTSNVNVTDTMHGYGQSTGKKRFTVAGLGTGLELTLDRSVSKLLCLHIPSLLPSSYSEFSTPVSTRTAALLGLGILYQGTGQRLMTETLLSEIKRSPCSLQLSDSHVNNTGMTSGCFEQLEGYSLAAGLALGLVLLGRGQTTTGDHGLMDLQVEETLYQCIAGGTSEVGNSGADPQSSVTGCLYRGRQSAPLRLNPVSVSGKKRFKGQQCSSGRRIPELLNINVTAPGSILALAFMYIKTSNISIAHKLALPKTLKLLECIRPDILMIRTIGKNLILWNDVKPTETWVKQNVPQQLYTAYTQVTGVLNEAGSGAPTIVIDDTQLVTVAYANVVAGACMSIGLRYAGTSTCIARSTLITFIVHFKAMRNASPDRIEANLTDKVTIERCLVVCAQSLALVDAGTGNIESLRLLRSLNLRQHVDAALTHGNHMALSMCIGLLFLGGGKATVSRSKAAIAALVIALYPIYPVNTADNKCHLQTFRHLYVLAMDKDRFVETISIDDCVSRSVSMSLQLREMDETTNGTPKQSKLDVWHAYQSPCILPEMERIRRIKISSKEYYPVDIMIPRNFKKCMDSSARKTSHDVNQTRIQVLYARRLIALKKCNRVNADTWEHDSNILKDLEPCTSWCHFARDLLEIPGSNLHREASNVLSSTEQWWQEDGLSLLIEGSAMCWRSEQLRTACLQAAATLGRLHCAIQITLDDLFNLKMFISNVKHLAKKGDRRIQDYAIRLEIAVETGLRAQWKQLLATPDIFGRANTVSLINYAQQVHPIAFHQLVMYLEGPRTMNLWLQQWVQVVQCANSSGGFVMENLDSVLDPTQAGTLWQELLSFFSFIG
uniref:Anaphasepromoting complex subunit putative n=1 Tax=Albugo laibachii Nc14 TaxID=890382 RepID=F0W0R3_9STRA|nr:anaphasepromoting complex subunit putative [Albugo laibachii Nc14]|eukprot:CCA14637.1 anaphasepromoting complex subunit putative [Albugo laibachii Nc14]